MEEPLSYYFFKTLNELAYKYGFFAMVKNWLREIKYFFVGKSNLALVIDQVKKARENSNPVKTVFDVGAAVGDKTTAFLKSYPDATVYSFEPQQESLDILKKRTRAYKDRIKIFDVGFFDKNDTVLLHINSHRDSSSILPLQKYMKDQKMTEVETRNMQVVTIDDFVKNQKIEHIDFIKIDVEGVEMSVLEGGKETFKNKIDNVFIEILSLNKGIHSKDFSDIFQFFYEAGFTFMGYYGDYFFSKDKDLLRKNFK